MSNGDVAYSTDFPAPDSETWLAMVERTLKGKPFDKAMKRRTLDGIEFPVLHTTAPAAAQEQPVRQGLGWHVTSPHWGTDPATINKEILTDLERGASAVALTVDAGLQGIAPEHLSAAFEAVFLDLIPVTLIQGSNFEEGCLAFREILSDRKYEPGSISGCLGVDPIGYFARSDYDYDVRAATDSGAAIASQWAREQPSVATFTADGTVVANAGGSEVQELSFALSSAVAFLRAMEQAGLDIKTAASQIQFTLSADTNLWLTIAKFRAARRLWTQVLASCGVNTVEMKLNAVSAVHKISKRDPWVNILRGTAACFAAGVAGADLVTTLPHDLMLGTTDEFSRRIARNIQIVLLEESQLGQVTDPAAGSFALEKLTDQVFNKSVTAFQSLESQGGVVDALKSGSLAAQIEETAAMRSKSIETRKVQITGVSEFPDISEASLPVVPNVSHQARLPLRRSAQAFEDLRMHSDGLLAKTGNRPSIFMANLGAPADFTARATFAKNFFEAGGIEAVPGNGGLSIADIAKQFTGSNSKIAVLCGTNAQYDDFAIELAAALKEKGCRRVYLAGPPNAVPDGSEIDDFAYMGANVIETVGRAYEAVVEGELS